jgi:hypothetical protein
MRTRLLLTNFCALLCALLLPPSALAAPTDLSISLPLGPYVRPGHYVPVRLTGDFPDPGDYWVAAAADNVTSRDDVSRGAGRTSVKLRQGRLDVTVPWLVTSPVAAKRPKLVIELRPESATGPDLQPLADHQRLVGHTLPLDPNLARQLLNQGEQGGDSAQIIPIPLDPAQPLKSHPCAYELLDAIVLDDATAARLRPDDIPSLLASGVTVAIRTARPPLPNWPWRRVGEYAVLRHAPVGVAPAPYHEAAYAPVANWQAGWPWSFRRRVLLIAAVCCVLILALALLRPRPVLLWSALLIAGLLTAVGKWWSVHLAIQQAGGEIVVLPDPANSNLTQTDAWTYQTTTAPRPATLQWRDDSRPIFASPAGVNDVWLTLNCDPATGRPTEFFARIPANRKIAFLSRTLGPAAPRTPPKTPVTSPLKSFAESTYATPTGRVTGQLPIAPPTAPAYGYLDIQQWNAVIIDPKPPAN